MPGEQEIPCKKAFEEKKMTVMKGPQVDWDMSIFLNIVRVSIFGKWRDTKLNQTGSVGPTMNSPYPPMRNVLIKSNGSEDGSKVV